MSLFSATRSHQRPPVREVQGDATPFTVMSYNVNFAFARRDGVVDVNARNVLDAVKKNPADIVFLQEVHAGWEHHFKQLLRKTHPFVHYHSDNYAAGGIAIHSRFPLSDIRLLDNHKHINGSWFPIWTGIVHLSDTLQVRLVNVHLRPPINEKGWPTFVMPWSRSVRQEELEYTLRSLESKQAPTDEDDTKSPADFKSKRKHVNLPIIIAGDFNESESERGLSFLKSPDCSTHGAFIDAVEQFVPTSQETHRWPLQIPLYGRHTLKHRLDHMAYRGTAETVLECHSCKVITGYEYEEHASDHLPLLAHFSLRQRQAIL